MRHNPAAYTVVTNGNNSGAHNPATLGVTSKSSLVNRSTAQANLTTYYRNFTPLAQRDNMKADIAATDAAVHAQIAVAHNERQTAMLETEGTRRTKADIKSACTADAECMKKNYLSVEKRLDKDNSGVVEAKEIDDLFEEGKDPFDLDRSGKLDRDERQIAQDYMAYVQAMREEYPVDYDIQVGGFVVAPDVFDPKGAQELVDQMENQRNKELNDVFKAMYENSGSNELNMEDLSEWVMVAQGNDDALPFEGDEGHEKLEEWLEGAETNFEKKREDAEIGWGGVAVVHASLEIAGAMGNHAAHEAATQSLGKIPLVGAFVNATLTGFKIHDAMRKSQNVAEAFAAAGFPRYQELKSQLLMANLLSFKGTQKQGESYIEKTQHYQKLLDILDNNYRGVLDGVRDARTKVWKDARCGIALGVISTGLGIAAVMAAGTFAAPFIAGGLASAGVISIGFAVYKKTRTRSSFLQDNFTNSWELLGAPTQAMVESAIMAQ